MEMVLPSNYIEVEQEEMMYLDGGLYLSNYTLECIVFTAVASGAITTSSNLCKYDHNNCVDSTNTRRRIAIRGSYCRKWFKFRHQCVKCPA